MGLLNGVYGGIGQSLGSLLGGALSKRYGIATTFLYCGAADCVVLALYATQQLHASVGGYGAGGKDKVPVRSVAIGEGPKKEA